MPRYIAENEDAIKIYLLTRQQLIMGNNGPIDINHQAIHEAMSLYEIRDKQQCFEKVLFLSQEWLTRMREKES